MRFRSPHVIGQESNMFIPPIYPSRPLGSYGQHSLVNSQFDRSGDYRNTDRFGWDIDFLSPYTTFDWVNSDGYFPLVGSQLNPVGSNLNFGKKTPYINTSDIFVECLEIGANSALNTSAVETLTSHDLVLLALIRSDTAIGSLYNMFFWKLFGSSPPPANPNIGLDVGLGQARFVMYGAATVVVPVSISNGWNLVCAVVDRDGNTTIYANGIAGTPLATPSLATVSNAYYGLGTVNPAFTGALARVIFFQGANIADVMTPSTIKKITNSILGIYPLIGVEPSFSRNSMASIKTNDKFFMIGVNNPCSGSGSGILIEPGTTNKVYRNYNPSGTAGLTATGGMTLAVVANDSTALASAEHDLSDAGPAVFRAQNTTGSTQYVYATPQCGNTNKHSVSVYARYISGSNVLLGLYDQVGLAFAQGVAINDDYTRTMNNDLTPISTDSWSISVPNNTEVYFILQQNEENWCCTSAIPNNLTASTVSRVNNSLDTNVVIDNEKGTLKLKYKSNFVGNVGATSYPLNFSILYFNIGTNSFRAYDGTNTAISTINVNDGNWHDIKVEWHARIGKFKLTVDNVVTASDYDGDWGAPFTVKIGNNPQAPYSQIKDFAILRN